MEQPQTTRCRYASNMPFEHMKFLVLSAWVASVITVGLILTINTPSLWVVVATIAVIPASVASWLWTAPPVALTQLIQKYRK